MFCSGCAVAAMLYRTRLRSELFRVIPLYTFRIFAFSVLFNTEGIGGLYDTQGPTFLTEPPNKLEFINSKGGLADCVPRGNPMPSVQWLGQDNVAVTSIPTIRHVLGNGTLHFPAFDADSFRQDVHWTIYRCLASNSVGTIFSRDVAVRAVVNQRYEPEVQSPGGFLGNNVIFRCSVPSFVKEYVSVTSWLQQPAFNIYPSTISDGKYHMLPTGELIIANVTKTDAQKTYRCRTHHRLTQEASVSRNEGKIQLSDIRGSVPPILNKKVVLVTAKAESTVVAPCVAYANPRPNYKWFYKKNQQVITNDERFIVQDGTLVLSNVKKSDAGTFYCNASNEEGSEILEMQLVVTSTLSAHVHPTIQSVHLGKTAEFECSHQGFPITSTQWLKDGQSLRFGNRIRRISDTRIQIDSVSKEDRGMYQCMIKNDIEMSQGSAELQLGEVYPQLLYKFIEQTMQPGPSVSLKCSASGNPTPQISWLLDGFPLHHSDRLIIGQYVTLFGDVVSHVNISSVKPEDGGEYECTAENRAGKASHSAWLNIYGLPYVRPMPPISAVAGKNLIVKCPVAGYPIEAISWEKEGVQLPTSIRQRVNNNTLIIENVQRDSDQGSYTCSARNKQGHASHKSVQVRVIVPPKITPFTFAQDLKLGDRISVQCVVVSGDLPLTFTWRKDGEPPPESDTFTVRRYDPFTSALSIGAIAPDHSGNYTCRVSNKAATVSHTAPLSVNVPPRISPFYFEDRVTRGMRTQVMCSVSQGDRPFNITWTKDGRSIAGSDVHISDFAPFSSILSIDNVVSDHSGNYTCTVSNGAGQARYTANLSVTVPPYWVVEPPREQSVILGNSVAMHCQADGFPKPSVTWKQALRSQTKSGQPGPDDYRELGYNVPNVIRFENGTLAIVKSTENHEGFYMCEASNGIGAGKSKFIHLEVHAGPKFQIRSRQETVRKGEAIHLRCEAEGDLPMQILWKVRGNQINFGYDQRFRLKNSSLTKGYVSELTILDVRHGDRGEYLCESSNAYGRDYTSILLSVQEPPGSPKNLHVASHTSRSITLSWLPPSTSGDTKVSDYVLQFKEARDVWHEHNPRKTLNGEKTVTVITDLKPATVYHFRLYAENQLGTSAPSDVLQAVTEGEPPAGPPLQITAEATSATAIRVTWNPPERNLWNGELLGYKIGVKNVQIENEEYNWTHVAESSGLPGDYRLSGLLKFTKYLISLRAVNAKGEGPPSEPVVVETMEDVPTAPPQEVHCNSLTAQSMQISWRSPPSSNIHGIIQGYKILFEPADELSDASSRETKVISSSGTVLHGLQPYTNYSLQVLAFTRAGDGARSSFIYCLTEESIPEAPSAVKAVVSSEDAVVISWLPPRRTNGILTKYTVYIRVLEQGSEIKIIKSTLPAQHLHYEAVGLKKRETYEAWVTASTKIGQGQSTSLVQLLPSAVVPASIISFGKVVVVPWKTEVRFPCLHVGQPRPSVEWRLGDVKIPKHSRMITIEEKSMLIENVARVNEGNYSCHVRNSLGSDHIVFALVVQEGERLGTCDLDNTTDHLHFLPPFPYIPHLEGSGAAVLFYVLPQATEDVPPTPPLLLATGVTTESVHLQWKQGDNGGAPVRGFILYYRKEGGEWEETVLESHMNTYLKEGLDCGTNYQFRLTAYNKIGNSVASKLNSVMTKGSRPIAPSKSHFLTVNSTYVVLHLRTWTTTGCDLTHFSLSYRSPPGNWFLVFSHLKPQQEFILNELSPGSEYVVKITGHNSAGPTSQEYVFTTLPLHGGPGPPKSATANEEQTPSSFYVETQVIVLGAISLLSVIFAVIGICFCVHKRPERENICLQDLQTSAAFDNTQNMKQREQYYATVKKIPQSPCRDMNALERIPEYSEDIYPYATFHLPEQENMSGNPQKSNYLYENQLKQEGDHYGMFRSGHRRKSKSIKSESEEYDSLGSDTDTEHGPISRTESANHMCDSQSARYQMSQTTLGRHRKKESEGEHSAKQVPRLAVLSRTPHHSVLDHTRGLNTPTELLHTTELQTRPKMPRPRYEYGNLAPNPMEVLLLSSVK